MGIKVHGLPMSTCTARVLLCLAEKGLGYELVQPDMANAAIKKYPHLSMNPFGQVPAFEDGDLTLFESRAICRYLARKHKDIGPDLLQSSSFVDSTIVDVWMDVEAQQFNPPTSAIIHQILINPYYGLASDEEVVKAQLEKLQKVLDVYEERLSKTKYLAGDQYTLADMHHIPNLVHFMKTPHTTAITSRPNVNAWWNDISSRPATVKVSSAMKK